MALAFGLLGIAAGSEGFHYAREVGPSGDDFTGLLCLPAGVLLLGVGAVTLWRTRRTEGSLWWRYPRRALIGAAAFVPAVLVVVVGYSYGTVHTARAVVPADQLGVPHENVTFETRDGLELEGWYIPSRNGAAVISFPGRNGSQRQARMLARHGYGVLLFDRRGEGRSEGTPNAWGWGGEADVKAAIDYLQRRPDVDDDRIGGIGLSVGGEMMIEAAAETDELKAVVSDGAGARSYNEDKLHDEPGLSKVLGGLMSVTKTASVAVFSNQPPPDEPEGPGGAGRAAAAADRRAEQRPRRGAQPRLRPRGRRQRDAVGDPRGAPRRRSAGAARGVRAARGRLLRRGAGAMRRVFVIATLVALVHAVDDAFVHRGPGLGLGQHALAGLVALAAGVGAIVVFPRLRPGLQAALSFSFGLFALVNGAMHIGHLDAGGPAGADLTGIAAAVAGVVLIALAAVIPWRHRGEGTWRSRAVAVPAGVLAVAVLAPIAMGIGSTHKWREPVGSAARRRLRGRRVRGVRRARSRRLVPPLARTAPRCSSSTAAAAIARARSPTRRCSPATATASCCTTRAGAARAKAARTTTAGTGRRTSPARSRSCGNATTSTPAGSEPSGCRPAPTR